MDLVYDDTTVLQGYKKKTVHFTGPWLFHTKSQFLKPVGQSETFETLKILFFFTLRSLQTLPKAWRNPKSVQLNPRLALGV